MKIIEIMNGWELAPHHWWRFILLPFGWEKTPSYISIKVFGFVIFLK